MNTTLYSDNQRDELRHLVGSQLFDELGGNLRLMSSRTLPNARRSNKDV
jgi:hypothetical protein